ncbi:MAG: winged helix-turn-helix transcriptional regulator [Microcoleus sp.]
MKLNLDLDISPKAAKWLKAKPSQTIARLVELAAGKSWLARPIAEALGLPLADRVPKKRGAPVKVSDDRLLKLRAQGLTQAAIASKVGLSRTQVGDRLRRLTEKVEKSQESGD